MAGLVERAELTAITSAIAASLLGFAEVLIGDYVDHVLDRLRSPR